MRRAARFWSGCGGFTLLEVTVAASLAILVFATALDLSWRGLGLGEKARRGFDETVELRSAVAWVTRDLRRARAVDYALPGSLSVVVQDASGPGGNWGEGIVTYQLENGNLIRDDMGWVKTVARGLARADFSAEERDGGVLITAEFIGANGGRSRACVWIYTGS